MLTLTQLTRMRNRPVSTRNEVYRSVRLVAFGWEAWEVLASRPWLRQAINSFATSRLLVQLATELQMTRPPSIEPQLPTVRQI